MSLKVIAGKFKGRNIKTLPGYTIRPLLARVKKSLFDILTPRIVNSSFLDLFAGSGSVGIEALSRGAKKVIFVENDPECLKIIEENLLKLEASEKSVIIPADITKTFPVTGKFDIIFIGPPYKKKILPDVIKKLGGFIAAGGLVITQNHYRDILPEKIGIFSVSRRKKYGDMMLSFYDER